MAITTLEKVSEDYPHLTLEEAKAYTSYVRMLEDWNEGKGFPLIDDPPPPPKDVPKWRGDGLIYFNIMGSNPGYGIAQRAKRIASCFKIERCRYDIYSYFPELIDEEKEQETAEWQEGLLDELQAYDVESIDVATVLHSYGCLFSFLRDVFSNKHACIRAKAAKLITSMVQNHPTSQQLVIEANGIQHLLHNFTTDPDTTSRTKTLSAISSLIRNNKSGIAAFLLENGYEQVRNALISETVLPRSSTYREIVNLIEYLRPGTLKSKRIKKKRRNNSSLKKTEAI